MRSISKTLWFLVLLSLSLALGRCGHKSTHNTEETLPQAGPYAPEDWSGEADWPNNALKVEDIAP